MPHWRTKIWTLLELLLGMILLMGAGSSSTNPPLTRNSNVQKLVKVLKNRCPLCVYTVTEGVMMGADGIGIPCVFVLVKDAGVQIRVERLEFDPHVNVVVVYFPGGAVDKRLVDFAEKLKE
jgi:hypothetical protein